MTARPASKPSLTTGTRQQEPNSNSNTQELKKVATISSNIVQWWTNDQTYFNEVVHKARNMPMNPKARDLFRRLLV